MIAITINDKPHTFNQVALSLSCSEILSLAKTRVGDVYVDAPGFKKLHLTPNEWCRVPDGTHIEIEAPTIEFGKVKR